MHVDLWAIFLIAALLIGAFVVVGGIVLLVVLLIRRPGARKPTAVVGGALALLLVLGLIGTVGLFGFASRSVHMTRGGNVHHQSQTAPVELPKSSLAATDAHSVEATDSAAWADEVGATFEADVHPSLESAARALGRQIAPELRDQLEREQGLEGVEVAAEWADASAVDQMAMALRRQLDETPIRVSKGPLDSSAHRDEPASTRIVVSTEHGSAEPGTPWEGSARHELRIRMHKLGIALSARFVDKPWVERFSEFASAHEGRWLVGRSDRFADSEAEALASAYRALASQMSRIMRAGQSPSGFHGKAADVPDAAQLEARFLAELRTGGFIVDRFVQRLSRPYGDVWRAAVLVEHAPDAAAEVVDQVVQAQHGAVHARTLERRSWAGMVLSIAGLVAVIFALYAGLNLATGGYYQHRLQVILVAALGVGVTVVLLLLA